MAKNVLIADDDATRQAAVARDMRRTAGDELAVPTRVHDGGGFPARSPFDLILHDLHAAATGALSAAVQTRSGPPAKGP